MRLVVGLGNPGAQYAATRHNAGFRLVERLAASFSWERFGRLGRAAKRGRTFFAEPLTYMNESGRFVAAFAKEHGIRPGEILVCYDDLDLPVGRIRIRSGGSCGGQKGMGSVIEALGTPDIPRLRLGIGKRPVGADAAQFVLEPFDRDEGKSFEEALKTAAEAVETALGEGLAAAMNRFNA